jgi:hypothetical protein
VMNRPLYIPREIKRTIRPELNAPGQDADNLLGEVEDILGSGYVTRESTVDFLNRLARNAIRQGKDGQPEVRMADHQFKQFCRLANSTRRAIWSRSEKAALRIFVEAERLADQDRSAL